MGRKPYVEYNKTEEGVETIMVENDSQGNDCIIKVPKVNLKSKKKFKEYNGIWPRTGYLYTPMKKEKENG